ncbi:hypothetical protein D9615_008261 [Tricholomella constricta]|uniref:Endonuclease/exonuclease/phosphatase domain-containing protein n=1 Tax=Tricholomella constricta TaxID=117010 RepID=A0A8H5M086_9AGAR|nr:hypothetical protein D9615_008261 [Tricholomella constricta]
MIYPGLLLDLRPPSPLPGSWFSSLESANLPSFSPLFRSLTLHLNTLKPLPIPTTPPPIPGMATTARPPPKPPAGGANRPGTPNAPRQLPSRADISTFLIGESGPVKSPKEARRWLETKGWILAGETYDRSKLVRVLLTAALNLSMKTTDAKTDAKNAVLAVAFLLEDDIADTVSDALVDAITTKALDRLDTATEKLTSSATFSSALDTHQAETTLALQTVSTQLAGVTASLEVLAARLNTPSSVPTSTQQQPTWADITRSSPVPSASPPAPKAFNPSAPDQHTRLQQRLLRGARTVLVEANPDDDLAPVDRSPTGIFEIRQAMNKELDALDKSLGANSFITEEGEAAPAETRTYVRGISALDRGAYLFELTNADAARRFREYATDPDLSFLKTHLGASARIKAKAYNLVFRFVPCGAFFDPSNRAHLDVIEDDNDLSNGSILSASWIKRPERRSPKQTVASLKVVCSTADAANRLLQDRVFVAGHLVVVRKDLKEPMRCNKCQLYGHIRASCKNTERCASCASADHGTLECSANHTPRCPVFKRNCEDLESRLPENTMPYFPTAEAWTWAAAPTKLSKVTPAHRPRMDDIPARSAQPASQQSTAAPPAVPRRQGTLDQRPSRTPSKLRIWQQNVRKSDLAQATVLNTARPEDWDVIALQEPFLDRLGNTKASPFWTVCYPYHHRRDGSTRSRSVLLINSNIATDAYTLLNVPSTDITAVRFNGTHGHLSVFNVYNDCTHNDSLSALSTYLSNHLIIAKPSPRDHMFWLGDFNRHHPLWESIDNRHLNSSEAAIRPLLNLLRDYDMELTLPPARHTLQTAGDRWTRPDNVWRSHHPVDPVISCDMNAGLRPPITDHLPIITVVELPIARTSTPPSRDFHNADWKLFRETLETNLALRSPARRISSLDEFDEKVKTLTAIIQDVIASDDVVPMKKPCPFSKRWWCPELDEFKQPRSQASNEMYRFRDVQDHPSKAEYKRLSRAMADKIGEKRREHWIDWLENIDARQIYLANKYVAAHTIIADMTERPGGGFDWSQSHNSPFELSKLALMNFPRSPRDQVPPDLILTRHNEDGTATTQTVETTPTYKYLGVVFDSKLRWTAHHQKVIASSAW